MEATPSQATEDQVAADQTTEEQVTDQTTDESSTEALSATQTTVAAPDADTKQTDEKGVTLSPETIAASDEFIGEWNDLVSTTNWDKGRVIADWRDSLEKEGAPLTERSDEAWVQLVGFVTSQHVGRLRRVHQRFGELREEYSGLYWSHFQTALDWEDAEMWLEGAIQNRWSVAKMRAARWEAVGAPDGVKPDDDQVLEGEIDGEVYDALAEQSAEESDAADFDASDHGTMDDDDSDSDSDSDSSERESTAVYDESESLPAEAAARVRPFENLADLPDDVAEAFEQFKLVVLSHRLTGWEQISRQDLVATLDSLKTLVMAPTDEEANAPVA